VAFQLALTAALSFAAKHTQDPGGAPLPLIFLPGRNPQHDQTPAERKGNGLTWPLGLSKKSQ
jgi:hypothetical protein